MTDNSPTQIALLEAGARLCGEKGAASRLTAAGLAKAAGVSEQDFQAAFNSLDTYRLALLRHMMDVVRAEVLDIAKGVEQQGFERIWRTVEAFLDVNLRHPAMRRLAYELRTDATAIDLLRQRTGGYAMVFKLELEAMGLLNSAAAARLATAMIVETAKAENEAGGTQLELRRALYAYLKGYVVKPARA